MIITIIEIIAALVIGIVGGKFLFAKNTQGKIDDAERQAKKILGDAQTAAENLKKEKLLEAKEKFVQLKAENEKEVLEKNRRAGGGESRVKEKKKCNNKQLED